MSAPVATAKPPPVQPKAAAAPAPATVRVVRAWPRPAPGFVWACVAWAALGLAVHVRLLPASVWLIALAGLVALALFDLWRLRVAPTPEVARSLPEAWPIGVERDVELRIEHYGRRQRVVVHDLHPGDWDLTDRTIPDLPRTIVLAADSVATLRYRLRPSVRGNFRFEGTQLRLSSPLRLWRQSRIVGAPQQVRVFPNFAPLAGFALFSAEQASRLVGAHIKRRRGEGTDFHQMREYRVGDSMRQIDWKATARARKLISREYQDEKNQQLLMVVDTGRRMLAHEGGLSHFDRALDATLVVSYIALKRGDAVGLFTAGGEQRWVAPQRGMAAIDTLLRASYDLQPVPVATDYLAASTELALRQRRRALVMLVTNLRDEDIEDVLGAVRLLQRRHLVVVASLRERDLDEALDQRVDDVRSAVRAAAAARYIAQRAAAHDLLRNHRVTVLDVTCEQLPAALVEQYLSIKRSGLL
ncbi:DUF58 domain-containing protein [Lysobacter hankyongensis]|uniref:DUF58 domain-containing protein n=1 Tax=Lysobacter hankyongensis TaxID=1176535 RepID=A0ABP9B6L4_9GAMM